MMGKTLKIKICGMKEPSNLEKVCALGPDMVGYIFFRGSRRFVGDEPDPALFTIPGPAISRVGVFVNEPALSLQRIAGSGRIDLVQLHGDESPGYCKMLVNEGLHVIKAMDPSSAGDRELLRAYYGVVHYFLFDTPVEGYGGSSRKFNWDTLEAYNMPVPFLLSGGIGPGDGPAIKTLDQLWLSGVDVNSRFETSPGMKDPALLEAFISELKT
jgi:phosphoribosylanthranilate isomerase